MVIAWHVTIAPAWFDPVDTPSQITPYGALHALHDALVRPLPGEQMGNSLAQSWTESADGLLYEFKLREGLTFHNGDPFTAEDVNSASSATVGWEPMNSMPKLKPSRSSSPTGCVSICTSPGPIS